MATLRRLTIPLSNNHIEVRNIRKCFSVGTSIDYSSHIKDSPGLVNITFPLDIEGTTTNTKQKYFQSITITNSIIISSSGLGEGISYRLK